MRKLKFHGSYDYKNVALDCSSSMVDDFKLIVVDSGAEVLVKTGSHDVQPEIDSYKDDVDIYTLVGRYMKGDLTAIGDPSECTFADTTAYDLDLNTLHSKYGDLMTSLGKNDLWNEFRALKGQYKDDKECLEAFTQFVANKSQEAVKEASKLSEVA